MRIFLLSIPLLLAAPLFAQSPHFRVDPSNTGVFPVPTKTPEGKVAWSFEAMPFSLYKTIENMDGGNVWPTTPAVVGGRIYCSVGPFLYAIDESGTELYRVRLSARTLASPAVDGEVVYVATDDAKLHALNRADGSELWACPIGTPGFLRQVDAWDVYHSSPTVVDGTIYIGGADGRIYAIAAADGKERWHFQTGHVVRATPSVSHGTVFCGSFDGNVYALDAATGAQRWRVDTRAEGMPWNSVQGSCAVEAGNVFVGSRSGFLYCIDGVTGAVRWQHGHQGSWVPSSPAVANGRVYIGQSDGSKVAAVDASGGELWVFDAPAETFASPALAGDVLYVACNDNYDMHGKGWLCSLEAKSGRMIWKLEFPASVWSSPVVAGDTVYVGCADGRLYAVR